ncbi:hypothetical protein [Peribacillus asahii]|nr:hypothetical protein LIT37_23520 [Peribacillus asahii]
MGSTLKEFKNSTQGLIEEKRELKKSKI